jgi:hypothetical protein
MTQLLDDDSEDRLEELDEADRWKNLHLPTTDFIDPVSFSNQPVEAPPPRALSIPAGVYDVHRSFMSPLQISKTKFNHGNIVVTPDSPTADILNHVQTFFNPKTLASIVAYDETPKSAVLMHGPGGTGKTYAIYQACKELVEAGWIVLVEPPVDAVSGLIDLIRNLPEQDKNQPVAIVWEEFETLVDNHRKAVLEFLDGKTSQPYVFTLATTNYLYKIPREIYNRPSRFSRVIEVASASESVRRGYYKSKMLPKDQAKWLEKMVADTEGMTVDKCKALMLQVLAYGYEYDTVLSQLTGLGKTPRQLETEKLSNASVRKELVNEVVGRVKAELHDEANDTDQVNETKPRTNTDPVGLRKWAVKQLRAVVAETSAD